MPTVQLHGHAHTYPVSDILRLFFGLPTGPDDQGRLCVGDPDPLIISSLAPAGDSVVRITSSVPSRPDCAFAASVAEPMARREIKRQLYQLLSAWTGLSFPWGSLTGIRPTLVAAECLARTAVPADARRELTDFWFVSPEKADLALETARAEQALLRRIPPTGAMVYIGVPFCPSRCAYCSFIAQDALHKAKLLEPYVEAIIAETRAFFAAMGGSLPVSAVYIGGGTPTSLPDPLFERLLAGVLPLLPRSPGSELTVEAGRPDTLTPAKLALIQAAGATRLCINPQTFHDATLDRIGRRHTTAQTLDAFHLARRMGFDRVNMDLIAGLPGETPADFADSLDQTLALGPDSVTVHTLAIKRSSRLAGAGAAGHPGLPDPALAAMLAEGSRRLKAAGLFPYYLYRQKDVAGGLENTGYARPGEGCLYNVGMMSDQCSVIGLGSGAMPKRVQGTRVERAPNPKDIADYIGRCEEMVRKKLDLFQTG